MDTVKKQLNKSVTSIHSIRWRGICPSHLIEQWSSFILLIAITIAMIYFQSSPRTIALLQYNRVAIEQGELYRIITSQLVHWNSHHAIMDITSFFITAAITLRFGARYLWSIIGISLFIPGSLIVWREDIYLFRGASAIVIALWVSLFLRYSFESRLHSVRTVSIVALLLFLGKLLFEIETGKSLFTTSYAFETVALIHMLGAIIGGMIFILKRATLYLHKKRERKKKCAYLLEGILY